MRKDYEILGIDENADEKTIKKAYFKLVRTYTPEKDPERFQEIRAAYERLTEAAKFPENQITLEFPEDDNFAKKMFDQIQQLMQEQDYHLAIQTAEEGLKYYPDMECFLYVYARCCILNDNAGKAIKAYQKLAERYPDKVYYISELAKAYYQRGYVRKAHDMFQRAYQKGVREIDFLLDYSACCLNREEYSESLQALEVLIDSVPPQKTAGRIPELLEAYSAVFLLSGILDFDPDKFTDSLSELLNQTGNRVHEYEDMLFQVYLAAGASSARHESPKLKALVEQIGKLTEDMIEREMPPEVREAYAAMKDERLGEVMKLTIKAFMLPDDENIPFASFQQEDDYMEYEMFMQSDAFLCLLEEEPKKDLALLCREYPNLYECGTEVWDLLKRSRGMKASMISSVLADYVELEKKFRCGHYYELYPNRRQNPGSVQWDSMESGTYVRDKKKIGRNSPCPCGSGKKYKNCCGKGVS